jgi:methionine synthase I (cobalamin-dependent)
MTLLAALRERILVADGATGTELIRMGAPGDVPGDLLNLTGPEIVARVHRSYVEAGSDLVTTNTFGGNALKLGKSGHGGRARDVNLAGARIARAAVPAGVLVGGDIGPTAEMLRPYGTAEPEAVRATFAEQAAWLAEGGVDFLFLETFFDLAEALLALEAARATGLPVVASMTFDLKRGGAYTMMGNPAADCARALAEAGAAVVGANCTVAIDGMVQVAHRLREGTSLPLILQPNAGRPELVDGHVLYRETPEGFAERVPDLVAEGARIVGGCCGTDPRFIVAVRGALAASEERA